MALVGVGQVLADPVGEVVDLGELVPALEFATGYEGGEAEAETNVVDVGLADDLVSGAERHFGRVGQHLQHGLAGESPALLVPLRERRAVAQRLGERDHRQPPVVGHQLVRCRQDHAEVHLREQIALHCVYVGDEVVGA